MDMDIFIYLKFNNKILNGKKLGNYELRIFPEDITDIIALVYWKDSCVLKDIEFFNKTTKGKYIGVKVKETYISDGYVDLIYTSRRQSPINIKDKIQII